MAERNPALPALGVRLQDLARRLGVTGFWAWWTRELNALVPAAPRAALARRRMRPVLVFEGDHATLWRPAMEEGRAVMVEAARIPLTGDAAAVAAAGQAAFAPMTMTRMAYGGSLAPVRAVISLGPRDVLRKRIVLPAAVEENFRQALAYDLDRHTPFKSDELYFDAAIVGARSRARHDHHRPGRGAARGGRSAAQACGRLGRGYRGDRAGAAGDGVDVAPEPGAAGGPGVDVAVGALAVLAAARTARGGGAGRGDHPGLAEARVRDPDEPGGGAGARAGGGVRVAAPGTRRARRRLQRGARPQVRVSERAGRGRHGEQAPARRHVADAVRAEDGRQGQGSDAARAAAARRIRQCGQAGAAVRGVAATSRRRLRARRRPRSSPGPARSSISARS